MWDLIRLYKTLCKSYLTTKEKSTTLKGHANVISGNLNSFLGEKKKHFCNFRTFVHAIWKPDLLYRGEKHHVHLVVKHNLLDRYLPPSKRSVFELRVSYAFKGFWHRTEFSGSHVDMSTLGPQRLAMQKSALLVLCKRWPGLSCDGPPADLWPAIA